MKRQRRMASSVPAPHPCYRRLAERLTATRCSAKTHTARRQPASGLNDRPSIVAWLDVKYKGIALVEGAGAGSVGLLGIPPDIVALITLNLRAIGEYATYYGFDVSS